MSPSPCGRGWGRAVSRSASARSRDRLPLRIVNLRSRLVGPFDLELAAGECLAITGPLRRGQEPVPAHGRRPRSQPGRGVPRRHGAPNAAGARMASQVVYNAAEPGWWHERVAEHFPGEAMDFARAMAPRLALASALLDAPVVQLSTGERQRMALIRALALRLARAAARRGRPVRWTRTARPWWRPYCANGSPPASPSSWSRTARRRRRGSATVTCAWKTAAWCRHEPDPAHPVRPRDRRRC